MLRVNNGNVGLGFDFLIFFFNNKANIFDLVSLAVFSVCRLWWIFYTQI